MHFLRLALLRLPSTVCDHRRGTTPFGSFRLLRFQVLCVLIAYLLLPVAGYLTVGQTSPQGESISPALRLWREIEPLIHAHDEQSARTRVARDGADTRALYRELLFEAVTALLYGNPPLPGAEDVRLLLVKADAENALLEAKFKEWARERMLGIGFAAAS